MNRFITSSAAALLLLVLMVASVGCEDSVLTAPTDATIVMAANPGTVVIDPNLGETEGTTTIVAQVFDSSGNPLSGVAVLFSTTGGSLASAGTTVQTNDSGIATDTLTVTTNSPQESIVSAQSSSVSQGVSVFRDVVGQDDPPLATIITIPPTIQGRGEQIAGQPITIDGTASTDDGGIECYQWEIDSNRGTCLSDPARGCATDFDCSGSDVCGNRTVNDEIIQGLDFDVLNYQDEQTLTIALRLSDDPAVGALCGETAPPIPASSFNSDTASVVFNVLCGNQAPVADAGEDFTNTLGASQFTVDARGSFDAETASSDLVFEWSCNTGSAQPPTVLTNFLPIGSVVLCQVPAGVFDTTYTPEVRVTDRGTGVPSGTGGFVCQRTSSDSVTVTIPPLP